MGLIKNPGPGAQPSNYLNNFLSIQIILIIVLSFSHRLNRSPTVLCTFVESKALQSQLLDCSTFAGNKDNSQAATSLCSELRLNSSVVLDDRDGSFNQNSSIYFNNTLIASTNQRTRRQDDSNCPPKEVKSTELEKSDSIPFYVCSPTKAVENPKDSSNFKSIEIFISTKLYSNESIVPSIVTTGSTFVAKCRFNVLSTKKDLRFELRWLRSMISNDYHGQLANQSIASFSSNVEPTKDPVLKPSNGLVDGHRLRTIYRDGGLDLEIHKFSPSDSGDYFCQAVTSKGGNQVDNSRNDANNELILDEKKIHIKASELLLLHSAETHQAPFERPSITNKSEFSSEQFSQENLLKLLPSLVVLPEFIESSPGESVQFSCITNELDPEPESELFDWSFQSDLASKYNSQEFAGANESNNDDDDFGRKKLEENQLPSNTTPLGNHLIIWNTSEQHQGKYKCTVRLSQFNLSAEATSSLILRPSADSAPLVFISPGLVRLSAGGSARVQCEATGYPRPQIEWYRVDAQTDYYKQSNKATDATFRLINENVSISGDADETIDIEHMDVQDVDEYCRRTSCLAYKSRHRQSSTHKVTVISFISIKHARADHQGQYVCKASNKHGTNQASSLVDVEFKEWPIVVIDNDRQTIVLPKQDLDVNHKQGGGKQQTSSVTFKCSVVAGRPRPRLRWLRASSSSHLAKQVPRLSNNATELDIYDLTKVSSATSRVSTWTENEAKTLALELSTISVQDEGEYVCLADNEVGRRIAVAHLNVREPAGVRIVQTSPKVARPNESFHLDCRISGHPAPQDIEWSRSDKGAFFALISSQPAPNERAVLKFDRVTKDDAGEYTCAARDPFNPKQIIRDTIMVLVEDESTSNDRSNSSSSFYQQSQLVKQIPQLMVRPTKVNVVAGSNITIDCLAMSGLQPTIVEWLAPGQLDSNSPNRDNHATNDVFAIKTYYRSHYSMPDHMVVPMERTVASSSLLQFGSKLRIFNASKAHEGVYQCKGRNRVGTENAPALIKIIEPSTTREMGANGSSEPDEEHRSTKAKIAQAGSNIELRCQVNGLEQKPATSWSRDGKELPKTSVQIEHNLWIQNLTQADEGLYLCSARSDAPNQIIQARIKLLVRGQTQSTLGFSSRYDQANLSAKIVASKSTLNLGDSLTLECNINQDKETNTSHSSQMVKLNSEDFDELERQVLWTNLHSGQSVFQDNVYIQNNLLIIYDLRLENSATYRCNYNDLMQHVDYQLQVLDENGNPAVVTELPSMNESESLKGSTKEDSEKLITIAGTKQRIYLKHVTLGSKIQLACRDDEKAEFAATPAPYYWTQGVAPARTVIGQQSMPLVLDSLSSQHANLYQCFQQMMAKNSSELVVNYIIHISTTSAKFVQRPVSFVTLPAASIATADRRTTEIEIKFLPERDHGLLLFSGSGKASVDGTKMADFESVTNAAAAASANVQIGQISNADFISVGLNRGHLELRFELGDGITLVRSSQQLALNKWHRVIIERNWRNSTLWLDGQKPQMRQTAGKFFDLNLDNSVLFVGGHQVFLTMQNDWTSSSETKSNLNLSSRFYGYTDGFQGCISYLRVNGREFDLMDRNRTVSVGVFECDKQECPGVVSRAPLSKQGELCAPNGFCQVDRSPANVIFFRQRFAHLNQNYDHNKRNMSLPTADLRCICGPDFTGPTCNETAPKDDQLFSGPATAASTTSADNLGQLSGKQSGAQNIQGPCEQKAPARPCHANGTLECQSLTSSSYKCHCRLGFMGNQCQQEATFSTDTSVRFNEGSFLQFQFHSQIENHSSSLETSGDNGEDHNLSALAYGSVLRSINASSYNQLISFTEQVNISFVLQTRASFALLFYVGAQMSSSTSSDVEKTFSSAASPALSKFDLDSRKLSTRSLHLFEQSGGSTSAVSMQPSKSVVANLLARLGGNLQQPVANNKAVADFLAIALIDGHVELSYELGSGPAIIRSSRRVNDGAEHRIDASRQGKRGQLVIDDASPTTTRHEGQSPGRLSMLNASPDIYLGGLPRLQSIGSSSALLMSTFRGCISGLQINSLGPLNLIRANRLTQIKAARNIVPCSSVDMAPNYFELQQPSLSAVSSTKKPTSYTSHTDSDPDDSDELKAAAASAR